MPSRLKTKTFICERCGLPKERTNSRQRFCGNYRDKGSCSYILNLDRARKAGKMGRKHMLLHREWTGMKMPEAAPGGTYDYMLQNQVRMIRDNKGNILGKQIVQLKRAKEYKD